MPRNPIPAPSPVPYWDRYQFLGLLGGGGMGRVYKARDRDLNRFVALKFIHGDDPILTQRLLLEAQFQASLRHDNICPVFDVGEVEGKPYISMQYIDGPTLNELGHLPLRDRVALLMPVAEAIHAAHEQGLIHRDIKPSNILVEQDPEGRLKPYVMDFGLARSQDANGLTQSGVPVGTIYYMAPEQAMGDRFLDARCDVYGLGATLYEILAGHPPFMDPHPKPADPNAIPPVPLLDGNSPETPAYLEALRRVLNDDPIPPGRLRPNLPQDLETITLHCLKKDPAGRYPSARALGEDLRRFLDGEPILARPPGPLERLARWLRTHRAATRVAAVFLALLLGLSGFVLYALARARAQTSLAQRFGQEAKEVETLLRLDFSLPLHDTRKAKNLVRQRIGQLREHMRQQGRWAEGPGHLALGRAYLALGELEQARSELEEAWKSGYRSPEVAQSLGLTLARLYETSFHHLHGEAYEKRQNELEVSLRQPALNLLRQGRQGGEGAYAEGHLALIGRDFELAHAKAREAQVSLPWFYEAWILDALISRAQAEIHFQKGEMREVLDLLEAMRHSLDHAQIISRSAPWPLEMEFVRRRAIIRLRIQSHRVGRSDWDWLLEPVDRLLQIDPDDRNALRHQSEVFLMRAETRLGGSTDPTEDLGRAEVLIHGLLIGHESDEDLLSAWTEIRSLKRGLSSKDPRAEIQAELRYLEQALPNTPRNGNIAMLLAEGNRELGQYQLRHGEDPSPALLQARRYAERALQENPHPSAYGNLLACWLMEAQSLRWRGLVFSSALSQAVKVARQRVEAESKTYYNHLNLGRVHFNKLWWDIEDSHLPDPTELALAVQETKEGLGLAQAPQPVDLVQATLLQARFDTLRGKESTQDLQALRQSLPKTLQQNPKDPEITLLVALCARERLLREAKRGRLNTQVLNEGLKAIRAAQRLNNPSNSDEGEQLLLKAELLFLGALPPSSSRDSLRAEAEGALEDAVKKNPNLVREADRLRTHYGTLRSR